MCAQLIFLKVKYINEEFTANFCFFLGAACAIDD